MRPSLSLFTSVLTLSLASASVAPARAQTFWTSFPAPKTTPRALNLWATFYHIYRAPTIAQGHALLNNAGDRLGPTLSQRDWCKAALQGTVQVLSGSTPTTYNFSGRGKTPQVNCAPFFSSLSSATLNKVSRVRFAAVSAPYGLGTNGLHLVPYRTIAVDRRQIPIGSVVFIPAARGVAVTLPTGDRVIHDGYFFAADVGSAIQGNHIDIFIGTDERSPFAFITSKASGKFPAYIVRDSAIEPQLAALHQR